MISNTQKIGLLINLTNISNIISNFSPINNYGANNYNYYYTPIFTCSTIINNIPVVQFTSLNEFIIFKFKIPSENFLNNVNLINITPYFYNYLGETVYASIDTSIDFLKNKVNVGDVIKIIFTCSETIGNFFATQGYIISKIPSDFILNSTFNFLMRIGNIDGTYNPGSIINESLVTLNTISLINNLQLYDSNNIIANFPPALNSEYFYNGNENLLNSLLESYNTKINYYINNGYMQINTWLYLQNQPIPPVNYAFQSFYDAISVNPSINLQANNTGENYFNSDFIDLTQYTNKNLIIIAVNQNKFGYGIHSNIQIYNKNNLNVIQNGSYLTSPQIPPISSKNYPFVEINDLPTIQTIILDVNTILSTGVTSIIIIERVGYNPINFNHSDYYLIPKFSVFISN